MGYDIIGDVHGHAERVEGLLDRLGYRKHLGAWRHPSRKAIFLGDLIDRGPRQVETVELVRAMVEAGSAHAIMGNHEFNALAYHTEDPARPGKYLRAHSEKNQREHKAFLDATAGQSELRRSILDWFMTLPLWLDLPQLRAVHACWNPQAMAEIKPCLAPGNCMSARLLEAASRPGSSAQRAVETILKGPEVTLPDGQAFYVGGRMRAETRTRWWNASATTFRESAIVPGIDRSELPESEVPAWARPGYHGEQPLFIGHYQLEGKPRLDSARVACLDYPVGGRLVAYRWDGEVELDPTHFVRSAAAASHCGAKSIAA